jgi:hypothetical protein
MKALLQVGHALACPERFCGAGNPACGLDSSKLAGTVRQASALPEEDFGLRPTCLRFRGVRGRRTEVRRRLKSAPQRSEAAR